MLGSRVAINVGSVIYRKGTVRGVRNPTTEASVVTAIKMGSVAVNIGVTKADAATAVPVSATRGYIMFVFVEDATAHR